MVVGVGYTELIAYSSHLCTSQLPKHSSRIYEEMEMNQSRLSIENVVKTVLALIH